MDSINITVYKNEDITVYKNEATPGMYRVLTRQEWYSICRWLSDNDVKYIQWSSGPTGIEFSIESKFDWFSLRWL